MEQRVKTDKKNLGNIQIPRSALLRIGKVFLEGGKKYGEDNWRNGVENREYQLDRLEHALDHLMVYVHWFRTGEYIGEMKDGNGGIREPEDDLAKVGWWVCTQIELERLSAKQRDDGSKKAVV